MAVSTLDVLRDMRQACAGVFDQLNDETIARHLDAALAMLTSTALSSGTIWLFGSGSGFSQAVEAERQLTTFEAGGGQTAAAVLGSLPSSRVTKRVKRHSPPELELTLRAKAGDCLWCFAGDPSVDELVDVAKAASLMNLKVLLSTVFPGTPVLRFSSVTLRLQVSETDPDMSASCVKAAHDAVAAFLCKKTREAVKRALPRKVGSRDRA